MNEFTVQGNVPSLKNGKRIITIPVKGQPGKRSPRLIPSAAHARYEKQTAIFWKSMAQEFRKATESMPKPHRIAFKFFRGSRHKFDYTNALDTIQDLMVKYGWIDDDNADELIPVLIPYEYDKQAPRVTITIHRQ